MVQLTLFFRKQKFMGNFGFLVLRGTHLACQMPTLQVASLRELRFPKPLPLWKDKTIYGGISIEQTKRKRPFAYTFRATAEEKKLIDSKLQASGLTMTEFIIRSITDKPVVVMDGGNEMLAELKRQGNNLNQAVRNCYFYPDEKESVLSAVADCKVAYRALLSAIGGS